LSDSPIQTVVVDGLGLAQEMRGQMAEQIAQRVEAGQRPPCLAVVRVGEDPASASYIKGKRRACKRIGMGSVEHVLPEETSEQELLDLVDKLNRDDGIDGILVQLPLPAAISPNAIATAIDPDKDVDGIGPLNAGRLLLGDDGLFACTPLGVLEILDRHGVVLEGADTVVIGRSMIVGKPVSLLLQRRHATVTMCHSRTRDLAGVCRRADVIVAAVGIPRLVKADWVKPGAVVIDVGATVVDGEPVGDVDFEAMQGVASLLTPHRRGVGPMTITMLLHNTLTAYRSRTASPATNRPGA
jgi:methylenetetrahydrofolate dehydrogenase (NADP+)/methenyltetrahydrofolate cyclohydrolase